MNDQVVGSGLSITNCLTPHIKKKKVLVCREDFNVVENLPSLYMVLELETPFTNM